MKDKEIYMPKREVTLTMIEMASQAVKEENKRRKKHNAKARKEYKRKKYTMELLPILHPAAVPTARKTTGDLRHVKGMDTLTHANRRLCGRLSSLCDALREAGLPYPWAEEGV